jgi:CarboxypepD_reg-like domain/Gram-negative bacterial TonB protein C-terminal
MPEKDNIKKFTAADIEKYHKGQLSAAEMHAMEMAALDDPFLADAMEGYAASGVNIGSDISLLKEKLDERISKRKITMLPMRGEGSGWWKIAAMIILVAGAGLLVYQFAFNKQSNETAILQKENRKLKTPAPIVADSVRNSDSGFLNNVAVAEDKLHLEKKNKAQSTRKKNPGYFGVTSDTNSIHDNVASTTSTLSVPVNKPPDKEAEEIAKSARTDNSKVATLQKGKESDEQLEAKDGNVLSERRRPAVQNAAIAIEHRNVFRGQVLDPNYNPLPFANVTNTRDNVGTYADAKGNFTLTSPDSVLKVKVRSIGFENRNAELKNVVANNAVVLLEDNKSIKEDVLSYKKFNTTRARDAGMVLEEPEPADGWANYDTYIANNLNTPERMKTKPLTTGEVEVSFDVNKNGEPVNIRVEKSLCKECDQEAIRLVKEGPKWNKRGKKSRAKVTVPF